MKNAKKISIAIVQVVIAGILVFIAIQHYAGSSATDESLTDSTIKSELENKENISENNDLHANGGGVGEISLEQTEDGSFKDPAIDHQDENNTSENNITSEPVIKGYDNTNNAETTPKIDFSMVETGDASWDLDGVEQGADLPTDEEMQWAMDLIEQNGTVLH